MNTQTPFNPSSNLTPQDFEPLPPNKRWEIVLGIILIVIILGTVGYFLLGKNNSKNKQPNPIIKEQPNPQEDDSRKIKNYTVSDVKNSILYKPYTRNSKFYILDNEIPLKDGAAFFLYCDTIGHESYYSCEDEEIKKAQVTLSYITAPSNPSFLEDSNFGTADGVMIMIFDFLSQKPKEYYLATFQFKKKNQINYLYIPPIKNLGNLTKPIKNIDIANKGEITLNIQTQSGISPRIFKIISTHRFYDLAELTPDKTKNIYNDPIFKYSFSYPSDINISYKNSLRNLEMEKDLKVSPVYHAEECGLQPTFADDSINFWASTQTGSIILNANITVHQIDPQTLYLTSALYGYDPLDWGKIKQKISIQDYINKIKNSSPITGRSVNLEDIQGNQVRHIEPFSAGRPCDEQYREQYQWVKGNLLFNLMFTGSKYGLAPSNTLKTKLINSIFSSLKLE